MCDRPQCETNPECGGCGGPRQDTAPHPLTCDDTETKIECRTYPRQLITGNALTCGNAGAAPAAPTERRLRAAPLRSRGLADLRQGCREVWDDLTRDLCPDHGRDRATCPAAWHEEGGPDDL